MDGNLPVALLRHRVDLSGYGRALYLSSIGGPGPAGCRHRRRIAGALPTVRSRINRRLGVVGRLPAGDTHLGLVGCGASLWAFFAGYSSKCEAELKTG